MTRNVIGRAERHKMKAASKSDAEPDSDIQITPAMQVQPAPTETAPKSMADKQRSKIEQHRQRSRNYYATHKDKVLTRIKEHRLQKQKQKLAQKLKAAELKEQQADKKKAEALKDEQSKSA